MLKELAIITAVGLACLGCVSLSMSMRRHYKQAFADLSAFERRRLPLRALGYVCIAASLAPCASAAGLWVGLVLWSSIVAMAATLQAQLLAWRPRNVVRFGGLSLMLVLLGLVL
jgi:hypothetical protein